MPDHALLTAQLTVIHSPFPVHAPFTMSKLLMTVSAADARTDGASPALPPAHLWPHTSPLAVPPFHTHTLEQTGSTRHHTRIPGDSFREPSPVAQHTHMFHPATQVTRGSFHLAADRAAWDDCRGQAEGLGAVDEPLQVAALVGGEGSMALHAAQLVGRSQSSPALIGASPPNSRKVP